MQDAKTGGSRWVPDIREDEITEFQEQNGDETATYKAVNVHPIISRVLDKLAFFRTHVSAVWYNKLANKTVKDKLDEIDTSISSLNSKSTIKTEQLQLSAKVSSANVQCKISGKIAIITGYLNTNAALVSNDNLISGFPIPNDGYRMIAYEANNKVMPLNLDNSGVLYAIASTSRATTIQLNATYIVADT